MQGAAYKLPLRARVLYPGEQTYAVDVSPERHRPLDAIDLLKAFAILGVLWQHTVPADITDRLWGNLWVRPAVPIFFVLIGLNLAGSLRRRGGVRWTPAFLASYLRRRFDRIAVPFLLVLAGGYAVAIARGSLDFTPGLLVGGMPVNAPGIYFITALIGMVVLFPVLYWAYERWPLATLVGCFAVNAAFELAMDASVTAGSWVADWTLLFTGSPLRYLALVALGVWAATDSRLASRRNRVLLVLGLLSGGYLVLEQLDPALFSPLFPPGFVRVTNFLAAPWAFLLVLAGLRFLPARAPTRAAVRGAIEVGRASFHIYLVQMLWTGVVMPTPSLAMAPVSEVASLALGYLYYRLVPSGSGLVRRRASDRQAYSRADVSPAGET